jgi:hypothetical protein
VSRRSADYVTVAGIPFPARREIVPREAVGPVLIGMTFSDVDVVAG